MKRVGLSLVISLALLIAWVITGGLLLGFVFPDSDEVARIFATSLAFLPDLIFSDFYLPFEDDYPYGLVVPFAVDVVIFAIPIYGVLTILAKRRPKASISPEPPPPPSFDS